MNENKITTYQNLQNAAKSVFRENLQQKMLMLKKV